MKYIAIPLLLLFTLSLSAQESESPDLRRQFGFDVNSINSLLPLDNSIGQGAPYFLHYLVFKSENTYRHHGLRIDIGGTIEDLDSDVNRNGFDFDIDYKFGKGKIFDQWKKFYFHGGINYKVSVDYSHTSVQESIEGANNGNKNVSRTLFLGVGPFVGAEYRFNNRLSLYTELAYTVGVTAKNTKFSSNLDPELSSTDNTLNFGDFFSTPRWLVLYYAF